MVVAYGYLWGSEKRVDVASQESFRNEMSVHNRVD